MPRAPKTKIDPDAPSKPKTAYIFFSKAVRESIKQENSSLMPTEIMSAIAARWQAVSPAEKEQYSKMAEEDKSRYQMEYQEYISSGKLEAWEKVHGETKKKKDPNAPKKTPTAYLLFSNEVRSKVKEENPDLTFGETMKKIGEMWNTLDTEEKSKYDKLAADMKENSKVAEQTSKLSQSNEMKENVIEENA